LKEGVVMKGKRIIMAFFIFASLTLLFSLDTTCLVLKKELNELAKEAEIILVGTVKDIRSEWNREETLIYTYVTISVEDYLKGSTGSNEVVVRTFGGKVGVVSLFVEDTPNFEKGEKVILFLYQRETGDWEVYGCFQGKYRIEEGRVVENGLQVADFINQIKGFIFSENIEK